MNKNPVGWFEIYVDEVERAKTFYQAVLGVPLQRLENSEFEMWTFPMENEAAGAAGALLHMEGFKAGGNSTLVYFTCDDCSVEEGRVEGAGGKIFKTKFSIGDHGFIALAYDTEGNMFGLHSLK